MEIIRYISKETLNSMKNYEYGIGTLVNMASEIPRGSKVIPIKIIIPDKEEWWIRI